MGNSPEESSLAPREESASAELNEATKQEMSISHLSPLMSPYEPGYMPLFSAAYWIASQGGAKTFSPTDQAIWTTAYSELLARISDATVKVKGFKNNRYKNIAGKNFLSCSVSYPYSPPIIGIMSPNLCLISYPYIDEEHWMGGFDDALDNNASNGWRRLQVRRSDVARYWPFGSAPKDMHSNLRASAVKRRRGPDPIYDWGSFSAALDQLCEEGTIDPLASKFNKSEAIRQSQELLRWAEIPSHATFDKRVDDWRALKKSLLPK